LVVSCRFESVCSCWSLLIGCKLVAVVDWLLVDGCVQLQRSHTSIVTITHYKLFMARRNLTLLNDVDGPFAISRRDGATLGTLPFVVFEELSWGVCR